MRSIPQRTEEPHSLTRPARHLPTGATEAPHHDRTSPARTRPATPWPLHHDRATRLEWLATIALTLLAGACLLLAALVGGAAL